MRNKFSKLIIAFLCGVLALSCNKAPKMQEVIFKTTLVETGSMTRAADHNEILTTIESTYTMFPVKLYTDETNNIFTQMEFGRTYTVPIGTWRVTGYNSSSITMTASPTNNYNFGKSPYFYTNTYVTIQYGTTEYLLPTEVRAVGIVYDKSEVSKMEYKGRSGSYIQMVDSDFVFSDDYGIFFINGNFSNTDQVWIRVTPKTGAQKVTEFMLCATEQSSGSAIFGKLESGKYFVLHPDAITELSGVSFSLSIPSWECSMD